MDRTFCSGQIANAARSDLLAHNFLFFFPINVYGIFSDLATNYSNWLLKCSVMCPALHTRLLKLYRYIVQISFFFIVALISIIAMTTILPYILIIQCCDVGH